MIGAALASPGAGAVGDPGLDALILPNPEPGWQETETAAVQAIVDRIQKIDTNAARGGTVQVAARLWRSPDAATDLFAITLSRWPSNIDNMDDVTRVALNDECVSVAGHNPDSVTTVPGLDGSLAAICSSTGSPRNELTVVAAHRGGYVEFAEGIGVGTTPVDLANVGAVASRQFRLLPAPATGTAAAVIGVIVLGAFAGGAVILAVWLVRYRRNRRSSGTGTGTGMAAGTALDEHLNWAVAPSGTAPSGWPVSAGGAPPGVAPPAGVARWPDAAPAGPSTEGVASPPGWYPVTGDAALRRYWDGGRWTATVRWDGRGWVSGD
jgi:hypothetical protein